MAARFFRRFLTILLVAFVACAATARAAEQPAKKKLLYFTKSSGFIHDSAKRIAPDQLAFSEKLMQDWAPKHGYDIVISKDGSLFSDPAQVASFDVLVFNTSGRLTDVPKPPADPKKDPARAVENSFPPMTEEGKENLLKAVAAGKGFVGIHSANDTFHSPGPGNETTPYKERDPFIRMLGSEFIVHGAQQSSKMIVTSPSFPGLDGVKDFTWNEEWYAAKNFARNLHVILLQDTEGMQGWMYQRADFPATYARMHQKGRVFYTSLGHREDVWTNPLMEKILFGGIDWAAGKVDFDLKPNIQEAASGANELPTPPQKKP